ncbi:MAG: alpha/beta fold hydrolase [Bacteroidetes bacterium]|nr:alpha/beta fold hydrolase [Bacteroidota bacterium]
MKKYFLTIFLLSLAFADGHAQNNFVGNWLGKLRVGRDLRIVFHVSDSGGKFSATMDSPDQSAKDIPCSAVTVLGDSIAIEMSNIHGLYSGKMTDSVTLTGTWSQSGHTLPMELKKVTEVPEVLAAPRSGRPQTPQPPFDYEVRDVIYNNADKSIQYGATITIPKGKGPFPAVLLITGSGQQNRDEEIFGHKPFAVIADYLTKNGYLVMRVDDRGVGKTTGNLDTATTEDFAKDATVSFEYMKTLPEANRKHLGLMGHSEGGMIAEMIAAERKDVDFVVLLAGPGVRTTMLMEEQNSAYMASLGIPQAAIDKYKPLYSSIAHDIIYSKDSAQAYTALKNHIDLWVKQTDSASVSVTTGIRDTESKEEFLDAAIRTYSNRWYRYFLSFDPKPYLKRMSCKVLALDGDKDIQVVSRSNLAGIRIGLSESKSKVVVTKEMKGLNHLFQTCTKCTVEEYAELEETFSPTALALIVDWLDKNVK